MPMKIFFFDTHVLNNRNSLTYLWLLRDMNTLSDTYKYDWFSYLPNGNRQIQPRAVVEALDRRIPKLNLPGVLRFRPLWFQYYATT